MIGQLLWLTVANASSLLVSSELPRGATSDPEALAAVARRTVVWLCEHASDPTISGTAVEALGIDRAATIKTLAFLAKTASQHPDWLSDREFLRENFDVYRWRAQQKPSSWPQGDEIRLTRYLVYQSQGSPVQTEVFDTALYASPPDELRLRLTRQQVYGGALEENGVPLVWMSRRDVNRAILQGSVEVQLGDRRVIYNVHRSNEIPYLHGVSNQNLQPRYWYFREVPGVFGYGEDDKILLEPNVVVAGDVGTFGLGRVILLDDGETARLVVLADTGGAFQPNLHQLDWYAGTFPSHDAFLRGTQALPDYPSAFFLLRKSR